MATAKQPDQTKQYWYIFGILVLSLRFVQGWIYWGGGSRRFIYAPQKLDPHSASYMAHKLQTAMPGALFEVDKIISYLLQHSSLLFAAVILFSLTELITGACLIAGFFTRLAGFISALLSISLMIMFGWQGSTCLDEWTMAVSNCAMGLTLALSGAYAYAIDALLARKYPHLGEKTWFRLLASGPLNPQKLKSVSIGFFVFTVIFTLGTYNYYRGSILSHYHAGPVDPRVHHVAISDPSYQNGVIRFQAYAASGDPATPAYIMKISLENSNGLIIRQWTGPALANWPRDQIKNTYLYNQFIPGKYSLNGYIGAKAVITLPEKLLLHPGKYVIKLETIDGLTSSLAFNVPDLKPDQTVAS